MSGFEEKRTTRISRQLGRHRAVPLPRRLPLDRYELLALSGPDGGKTFTIQRSPVQVGHGAENDICLTDETVSRVHLSIEDTPDGHRIKDLGSTNGTRVNGVPVVDALLLPGADIALGETTLRFQPRRDGVADEPDEPQAP
ncbi:MAG: FHA domain-containing protein [Candidatus Riflebacteria bacterium]|nr:FHA domain-containing protein [Candidatus Riflebacteria bacterium]